MEKQEKNDKEKPLDTGSHTEEAPPPYSAGTFQQQAPAQTGPSTPQLRRQFPPSFNVYRSGLMGRSMTLGEHENQPLYAITRHTGWSGEPNIVVHNGPSDQAPPLAAGDTKGTFSRHFVITLPPLPRSGLESVEETVRVQMGFVHHTYQFEVEVGADPAVMRREPFEWRHSHGSDVDALNGTTGGGWKLVRLAPGPPPGMEGAQYVPSSSSSSDGMEVVAVWTRASMSMSKILKFSFVGSGANGVLGERWAVMAVVTALKMWDKLEKDRQAAAASS